MNLWGKRWGLGAILIGLTLFCSCEESGTFGLGEEQNPVEFDARELDVLSSVVQLDSIVSFDLPTSLVGYVEDPVFGNTLATSYSSLRLPVSLLPTIEAEDIYDSLTIDLQFNYSNSTKEFVNLQYSLVTLAEGIDPDDQYYTFNEIPLTSERIGTASLSPDPQKFDTTYSVRVFGSDDWGMKFFELIRSEADEVSSAEKWLEYFPGVAIVSGTSTGGAVMGINPDELRVVIHYHSPVSQGEPIPEDVAILGSSAATFFNLKTDRTGSQLGEISDLNTEFFPLSGLRYIQEGELVVTKLDISNFADFIEEKKNEKVSISLAEISVGPIEELEDGFTPPRSLIIGFTDDSNKLILDGASNAFRVVQADGRSLLDVLSNANPLVLAYNEETRTYRGSMTHFMQSMLDGDVVFRDQLLLYPTGFPARLGGMAVSPDNINIKLFFSELKDGF